MNQSQHKNTNTEKKHFLKNKEQYKNNKETNADGAKNRKEEGFTEVFFNITGRSTLPEEASTHRAEMLTIKTERQTISKIHKLSEVCSIH